MIEQFLCDTRRQIHSIVDLCEEFGVRRFVLKESIRTTFHLILKSSMIELFLCDARRQIRSIVDLCEEFGVRRTRAKRANQNDFILNLRRFRLPQDEYLPPVESCSNLAYA